MSETNNANNGVYFLSLELENVRCFGKKQKLDLSDGKGNPAQWTVILGNNGIGKTTLLQALAGMQFITTPEEKTKKNLKLDEQEVWYWLRRNTDGFNLTSVFSLRKLLNSTDERKESIKIHYSNVLEWSLISGIDMEGEIERKLLDFTCIAYGANRSLTRSSLYKKEKSDKTASLFSEKSDLIDAEEWILRKDYAASKESPIKEKAAQQLSLIMDILINLLPDVTEIGISTPNEENPNPTIGFKTPFGWGRLKTLSLGYQSMIAWVVDLAACLFERYPDSPNPIAEPAVVLIDEIDLHLHPKWQREIMRYLSERFINTQFIVTAHSPLIVQAAEDENANIVVLRREGDEVIIDQQHKAIHGWRVDQLLASDLFDNQPSHSPKNEKLLKERRTILGKPKLTAQDKKELKRLDLEMGDIPTAETPEDIKAMDIIRRAAKLLEAEND